MPQIGTNIMQSIGNGLTRMLMEKAPEANRAFMESEDGFVNLAVTAKLERNGKGFIDADCAVKVARPDLKDKFKIFGLDENQRSLFDDNGNAKDE